MTTPTDDELLAQLRDRAGKLREAYAHAEANRDGWFATMPPEIGKEWLSDADMFEAVAALIERHRAEVERLTREKNKAEHDVQSVIRSANALASQLEHQRDAAESALAAERKRCGDALAIIDGAHRQRCSGYLRCCDHFYHAGDIDRVRDTLAGKDARGKHEATGA